MKIGTLGEKIAKKYLIGTGYRFVDSNYRTRRGEIDLIMKLRGEVVFVEVKTRRHGNNSTSNYDLPTYKLERLQAAIDEYCQANDIENWSLLLFAVTILPGNKASIRMVPL